VLKLYTEVVLSVGEFCRYGAGAVCYTQFGDRGHGDALIDG
jgi:hypothetical protein